MQQKYNYDDFWLIFMPGDRWYTPFLKKDFGHCTLLMKDVMRWIEINPASEILNVTVLPYLASQDVPTIYKDQYLLRKKHVRILRVRFNPLRVPAKCHRLPSCVGVVLYSMGLRLFCATPYSLFKKLTRMNKKDYQKYGISHIDCL